MVVGGGKVSWYKWLRVTTSYSSSECPDGAGPGGEGFRGECFGGGSFGGEGASGVSLS